MVERSRGAADTGLSTSGMRCLISSGAKSDIERGTELEGGWVSGGMTCSTGGDDEVAALSTMATWRAETRG